MSRFTLYKIFNKKPRVNLWLRTLHTRFNPVFAIKTVTNWNRRRNGIQSGFSCVRIEIYKKTQVKLISFLFQLNIYSSMRVTIREEIPIQTKRNNSSLDRHFSSYLRSNILKRCVSGAFRSDHFKWWPRINS